MQKVIKPPTILINKKKPEVAMISIVIGFVKFGKEVQNIIDDFKINFIGYFKRTILYM